MPLWFDPSNVVCTMFYEPKVAIRPGCDSSSPAIASWDRKLGEGASRGDTPDLVVITLGEPDVTIRSPCDAESTIVVRNRKLGEGTSGGDTPNPSANTLGEPKVAIRPPCDVVR